jgi:hypothetical protein
VKLLGAFTKHCISIIAGSCLICLGAAHIAAAVSLTETVDAGEFLFNAGQSNNQVAGTTLDNINGSLTDTGNPDIDLYQFQAAGATFTASTVGGTNIDTQLFLFNASGIGFFASDNADNNTFQSSISANLTPGQIYYLGISSVGSNPQSSDGEIFNIPLTGQTSANGSGAAGALNSWSSNPVPEFGSYNIAVTGAQFVGSGAAAVVPFDFNPTFGAGMLGIWTLWNYLKRRKSPE